MAMYVCTAGLLQMNFGSLKSERMWLKVTDVPRVERAITTWKRALNHAATEMPECWVMDLMRGKQESFS